MVLGQSPGTLATHRSSSLSFTYLNTQDPEASLYMLDAESEGQIGYLLQAALANALPGYDVVTLLTQAWGVG